MAKSIPDKPEISDTNQSKNEIEATLAFGKGTRINLCYAIFRIILKAGKDYQFDLLRHAAKSFDETESSEEQEIDTLIPDNEAESLRLKYGDVVDEMLALLISENLSEDDFYKQLWAAINNPLFSTEKARVFALFYTLIDKRIPYFRIDRGFRMSNEDFKKRVRTLRTEQAKLRFLLARDFDQRTEQADLILQLVNSTPEPDNIVLIASLIARLQTDGQLASAASRLTRRQ